MNVTFKNNFTIIIINTPLANGIEDSKVKVFKLIKSSQLFHLVILELFAGKCLFFSLYNLSFAKMDKVSILILISLKFYNKLIIIIFVNESTT